MTSTPNNKGDIQAVDDFEKRVRWALASDMGAAAGSNERMSPAKGLRKLERDLQVKRVLELMESQRQADYDAVMAGLPEKISPEYKLKSAELNDIMEAAAQRAARQAVNLTINQVHQLLDKVYKGE